MVAFVVVCEFLLPFLIVGRDPERVLELLLPSFRRSPGARPRHAVDRPRRLSKKRAARSAVNRDEEKRRPRPLPTAYADTSERKRASSRARSGELLKSIVDFGDTLVREVMTPRPDIVALPDTATIGDLRALFREQEYSRFPVYKDNLDNIAGFVFVKDLVAAGPTRRLRRPSRRFCGPRIVVPETKRVPRSAQAVPAAAACRCAIVVDEYGGTAGLVTVEDLLEEIVGEIRDEYDVESEPIVDEGNGSFLFSGKVDVDEVAQRLNVPDRARRVRDRRRVLLSHIGRVPAVGERFDIDGLHVEVLDAERRRINKVRMLAKRERTSEAAGEA